MATQVKKANNEVSFEVAMERLEKIVEEMESGKMLLDDLLVRYEEGMKLVKLCQERLAKAEHKIQIITRDYTGKTSVENFESTQAQMTSGHEPEENKHDDVSLF